jgi:hypothetical protein
MKVADLQQDDVIVANFAYEPRRWVVSSVDKYSDRAYLLQDVNFLTPLEQIVDDDWLESHDGMFYGYYEEQPFWWFFTCDVLVRGRRPVIGD